MKDSELGLAEQARPNSANLSGGSITGTVQFLGKTSDPQKLLVVKDVEICAKTTHYDERLIVGANDGIRNAVISLSSVEGGKPLSTLGRDFFIDQKECRYEPHILIAPVHTPVQFLNNDGILHNIHTFSSKNTPVNLAQPQFKKKLEMIFNEPENISIKCDVHGWMSAWIIVVDHPYFTLSDSEGNFSLTDVPPGTYTIKCWQELLGEQSAHVTVQEDKTVEVRFNYSFNQGS